MHSNLYSSPGSHDKAESLIIPRVGATHTIVSAKVSSRTRLQSRPPSSDTFHQKVGALFSDIEMHCDLALKQVDVSCRFPDLPKEEVYDLWVRLDLLPSFMRGLTDDTMPEIFAIPWAYKIKGQAVRWEAWTIERLPGECIAWRNVDGAPYPNHGSVTFSAIGNSAARICVNIQFDGQNAEHVEEQTLKSIAAVFRNSMVALRILSRPISPRYPVVDLNTEVAVQTDNPLCLE